MKFDNNHLKRLDKLCLRNKNTLLDSMCLNISDINLLSSFIMRNEKSEIFKDFLIVFASIGCPMKEIIDTLFLNNVVIIP